MQNRDFSYPQWMNRMVSDEATSQRMEEITARYAHLLFSAGLLLDSLRLEEIRYISSLLESLPSSSAKEVLLAPYLFADLYLQDTRELQTAFNNLSFPMQCKVLDTARLYRGETPPHAMVALDWDSGGVQLLALSSHKERLQDLALAFVTDPLTKTLIDERYEPDKAYLLSTSKALLLTGVEDKRVGLYEVTSSEELFVNRVLSPILDAPFTLIIGEEKDRWGRSLPSHIREAP